MSTLFLNAQEKPNIDFILADDLAYGEAKNHNYAISAIAVYILDSKERT